MISNLSPLVGLLFWPHACPASGQESAQSPDGVQVEERPTFVKWRSSMECIPNTRQAEKDLGKQFTVEACHAACLLEGKDECNFFIFGKFLKAGICFWEFDDTCVPGAFEIDDCDLYRRESFTAYEPLDGLASSGVFFLLGGIVSILCAAAVHFAGARILGLLARCRKAGGKHANRPAVVRHDGRALHTAIPPSRWCVTRADLVALRREVEDAIAGRSMVPSDRDPFDPADQTIGPSIHTLTEQFIKPRSAAAGDASWALMCHPEGLPCDLFVTHSWREGTFEFIDKVLNSWPAQANHAYCCMLSNPQNLDLSEYLDDPRESPFAQALQSAKYVLVVPNQRCSVYTRIWCAYEAFLGYKWGKLIFTASPPVRERVQIFCRAWFVQWLSSGLTLLYLYAVMQSGGLLPTLGFEFAATSSCGLMVLCTLFIRHSSAWYLRALIEGTSILACVALTLFLNSVFLLYPTSLSNLFFFPPVVYSASIVLEMERIWCLKDKDQKRELRDGYTGHLRDAQCTIAADGRRIRDELAESGSEEQVDEAVELLIRAGMSTPHLRLAAEVIGNDHLENAGRWRGSTIFAAFVLLLWLPCWFVFLPEGTAFCREFTWIAMLSMFEAAAWALLFLFYLARDRRGFAVSSLRIVLVFWLISFVPIVAFSRNRKMCLAFAGSAFVGWPLSLGLSFTGLAGTVRLPLAGPTVAKVLMDPSWFATAIRFITRCVRCPVSYWRQRETTPSPPRPHGDTVMPQPVELGVTVSPPAASPEEEGRFARVTYTV